ncbi:MAG: DUF1592 domain-containing protein, partial [Pseudomonadota bacterium]
MCLAPTVLALAVVGCLRERHLVGDLAADAAVAAPEAGGDGASLPADSGSADGEGGPAAMTVVSLGDRSMLGWPIRIPPEEVARRLSQFVLRRPPSAQLIAAVVASAPRTNEDVGQLADGLLLNEDSAAGRRAFYTWWLDLDTFATKAFDAGLFPSFTAAVRAALVDETLSFVEDVT